MIHPSISIVFPNNQQTVSLFSWICKKIDNVDELNEFVMWHLDIINQTINEIAKTQKINLSNNKIAKEWAVKFLENYEERIRKMRNTSNQVFERFHHLKDTYFKKIIDENKDKKIEIEEILKVFHNNNGLLIGKIIFAYRETWFLAKQLTNPESNLSSVEEYQKWVTSNMSNLKETRDSLEKIHEEIKRCKE
ncbi:hypothetical protein [Nitrosopumilus sp. S4]